MKQSDYGLRALVEGRVSNACVLEQSRSSFVGGSTAMLLSWRRINGSCARRKSKKGWAETRRCVLGLTCNKPMRVPPPIPFKNQRIGLDQLVFWHWVCSLHWDRNTSETLIPHVNCSKDNLTHIWYADAVLWLQLWVYLMIRSNTVTNIVCYQYCIHYHYRLVFIICMCPSVNIHCHGLYHVLRV